MGKASPQAKSLCNSSGKDGPCGLPLPSASPKHTDLVSQSALPQGSHAFPAEPSRSALLKK